MLLQRTSERHSAHCVGSGRLVAKILFVVVEPHQGVGLGRVDDRHVRMREEDALHPHTESATAVAQRNARRGKCGGHG
jgi:hypothetical protein